MLTKCKDVRRLDPEKDISKLLENVFKSGAYAEIFFTGMEHQILAFFKVYFFGRINLKQIQKQKRFEGVRGMLPEKLLKIYVLHWPFQCFLNDF